MFSCPVEISGKSRIENVAQEVLLRVKGWAEVILDLGTVGPVRPVARCKTRPNDLLSRFRTELTEIFSVGRPYFHHLTGSMPRRLPLLHHFHRPINEVTLYHHGTPTLGQYISKLCILYYLSAYSLMKVKKLTSLLNLSTFSLS
jgi:hypothetical protein